MKLKSVLNKLLTNSWVLKSNSNQNILAAILNPYVGVLFSSGRNHNYSYSYGHSKAEPFQYQTFHLVIVIFFWKKMPISQF